MTKPNTTYHPLGDYIRKIDKRNRDLALTKPMGINIDKQFMPSVANVIGTDMSNYKLVGKNQFACNLMHVGRDGKIPVAINTTEKEILVSPAYHVFEIVDKNVLSPDFLMMWFRREEFDREASFYTDADVRSGMDFKALTEMHIPVPPIAEQRAVVADYEAVARRIAVAKRTIATLQATAQALYRKMFVDGIDKENLPEGWRWGTLGEYATVKSGFAFKSDWWQKDGVPVIRICDINGDTIQKKNCLCIDDETCGLAKYYAANKGDLVIAMTGSIGKVAIVPENGFYVNQRVGVFDLGKEPLKKIPFLYLTLKQDVIVNNLVSAGEGGSVQANISNKDIESLEVLLAPRFIMDEFNFDCSLIIANIIIKQQEIEKLTEIQTIILSGMGR